MRTIEEISDDFIGRAREAQRQLAVLTQQEVDSLAFSCGRAVHAHAEYLARLAVDETGMGNVEDKKLKKCSKAETTWFEIKDQKTVGIVSRDVQRRLVYYADPIGVVAGVAPCTNPVATAMYYAMICLKTRNSLLVCPHPRSIQTTLDTVRMMKTEMKSLGVPEHAVQVVFDPLLHSKERIHLVSKIMEKSDLVIATGGPKLVEAAYHCGKPAYGVGAGNTPVVIHPSAEEQTAVRKILEGRCFDNGIICASEQHVIALRSQKESLEAEFERHGAYVVKNISEQRHFEEILFDPVSNHLRPEFIGIDCSKIARRLGIFGADSVRCIVFPLAIDEIAKSPLSGEKMAPLLSFITVADYNEAISVANRLLDIEGKGHTAAIHIDELSFENDLMQFAASMPATHIIVNMAAAKSSGGSRFNGLTASTTLGCGAYGGTMPMETINLTVKQLLNYKAVSMPLAVSRIPEDVFV
jgi:succinate-semialdehyde dehydrogenase